MASDLDYEELLDQAKSGQALPPEALEDLRNQLATGVFRTDPYTLIHILGRSGDLSSKEIIERYLDFTEGDPDNAALVQRIAVQVLGRMWALREVFPILATKAFSDNYYVASAAATALGFLASRHTDLMPQAARLLLEGLRAHARTEPELRDSFYTGLLELLDVPISEWPLTTVPLRDDEIRGDVLDRARRLAEE